MRRWTGLAWALIFVAIPVASSEGVEPKAQIRRALEVLAHVPTGKRLLARAQAFWGLAHVPDLEAKLEWGPASKTDAVLTRHYNPRTGEESRERQVTIYLRASQGLDDLVLDLAHELVHATSRPGWDPYDARLTAGKYIWAAIEGEGGEVRAVDTECRVSFEIHDYYGAATSAVERCQRYLGSSSLGSASDLDADLIRKDFYRVGRWRKELLDRLGQEKELFPLLSAEPPKLYSSTGNAPYPVALYHEFEEVTQVACENSRKRIRTSAERGLASTQGATVFVSKRCDKRAQAR